MKMHTSQSLAATYQLGVYGRDLKVTTWLTRRLRGLIRLLRQRLDATSKKRGYRRNCWYLMAMDDRLLRDIGIDRGQIHFAVRHGRCRDR